MMLVAVILAVALRRYTDEGLMDIFLLTNQLSR